MSANCGKRVFLTIIIFVFQISIFRQTNVSRKIKKLHISIKEKAARRYFAQIENMRKFMTHFLKRCENESVENRKHFIFFIIAKLSGLSFLTVLALLLCDIRRAEYFTVKFMRSIWVKIRAGGGLWFFVQKRKQS